MNKDHLGTRDNDNSDDGDNDNFDDKGIDDNNNNNVPPAPRDLLDIYRGGIEILKSNDFLLSKL